MLAEAAINVAISAIFDSFISFNLSRKSVGLGARDVGKSSVAPTVVRKPRVSRTGASTRETHRGSRGGVGDGSRSVANAAKADYSASHQLSFVAIAARGFAVS